MDEHPSGQSIEDDSVYRLGHAARRFELVAFDDVGMTTEPAYLVKGLVPREGLTVIWGPPKCGKSFWAFDLAMHIALGRPYRGRRVQQGPVVYIAAEGGAGFRNRIEAFRQAHVIEREGPVPFYLLADRPDLVSDVDQLIADIREQCDPAPVAIEVDTLNRTLTGSESRDEDMAAYIAAADKLRAAFRCAVKIVHHCGIDATRPRGHTSLVGAVDAQIKVSRAANKTIAAQVEWMKDGEEGDTIHSVLEQVDVGTDEDGDPITSCVVRETDGPEHADVGPRLTKNQATMFSILKATNSLGLTVEEWNEQAKAAGIGNKRAADLYDHRMALKRKGLVYQSATSGQWVAQQ